MPDNEDASLWTKLWIYQAERFPLVRTAILTAVFAAASINLSSIMAGRGLPPLGAYLTGFAVVLILFFQMRACDEVKDRENDARHRPELPIPRGLVSLRLIVGIGLAGIPAALLITYVYYPPLIWLLLMVWAWLVLMTAEFGAPDWLRARPLYYLLSHMLIMPLIDLYLTGTEWLRYGYFPPAGLWIFLILSFVNGSVLEVGRKIYAPQDEQEGVDTYSILWGSKGAALIWLGIIGVAYGLLMLVGVVIGFFLPIALVGGGALAVCVWTAWRHISRPGPDTHKLIDTVSGVWILVCYVSAGILPVLARAFA